MKKTNQAITKVVECQSCGSNLQYVVSSENNILECGCKQAIMIFGNKE